MLLALFSTASRGNVEASRFLFVREVLPVQLARTRLLYKPARARGPDTPLDDSTVQPISWWGGEKNSNIPSLHIARMWTVPSCFSAERATVPTRTGAGTQATAARLCRDFRGVGPTHAAGRAGSPFRERGYVILRVAGNAAGPLYRAADPRCFPVSMIVLPSLSWRRLK